MLKIIVAPIIIPKNIRQVGSEANNTGGVPFNTLWNVINFNIP